MAQEAHITVDVPRSVALFDLSYSFRRNWHAQAPDAEVNDAPRSVLAELAQIRSEVDHVIVCCDHPPYWRKKVAPTYKATREAPSDGMKQAMRWLKERIDADGYQVASVESFEADDVAATLARQLYVLGCQDIRIVGSDKDLAQCIGTGVKQYVPAVGNRPAEIRGEAEVVSKFGVEPWQMPEFQALVGDTSDNINGIPGIGPKRAAQILGAYETLENLYADLESDSDREFKLPLTEKMISALRLGRDALFESVQLTTLRTDVPLDVTALLARKEVQELVEVETMQAHEDDVLPEIDDVPISPPPGAPRALTPLPPKPAPVQAVEAIEPVRVSAPSWNMTLQPSRASEAFAIAKALYNSRLYSKFNNPDAIAAVILRGREIGVGMTTALDSFHVIEGKPSPSADLIRSLAEADPNCEYLMLVSCDSKHATWETKHRKHPKPITYTYTIDDAVKADLVKPSRDGKPSNWMRRPQDMLVKTAGSKLARIAYPAATCGLCCPEEMDAA